MGGAAVVDRGGVKSRSERRWVGVAEGERRIPATGLVGFFGGLLLFQL